MKLDSHRTPDNIDFLVRNTYIKMLSDAGGPDLPDSNYTPALFVSVSRDPVVDFETLRLRVHMDVKWRFDMADTNQADQIGNTLVIHTRDLGFSDSRSKVQAAMKEHAETVVNLYKLVQP